MYNKKLQIIASLRVIHKLQTKHNVTLNQVEECFANQRRGFIEDARIQHRTFPPTMWFIAQTAHNRLLKVVFIERAELTYEVKTAYEPSKKKKLSMTELPLDYDVYDDAELWESGQLGASEEYARAVSAKKGREIDKAIGIESVMVRMPKGLADELKKLAKKEKMGYMPFIRAVLDKYVCRQLLAKRSRQRKSCS